MNPSTDENTPEQTPEQGVFRNFFGCLPGMEPEAAGTIRAAQVQATRQQLAQDLAERLTGRKMAWVEAEESWLLVDQDTGEVWDGSGPAYRGRAGAYAALLLKAALPSNHVAGVMDSGEEGLYAGGTALWKPSLRIDPNWAETMRRRSRKIAKTAMKEVKESLPARELYAMAKGYNWRLGWKLLTLTMPHWEGEGSIEQIRHLNRAMAALGKMTIWGRVHAGVKGVEDKLTASGPHVHAHLLILSRHLNKDAVRQAWTSAVSSTREEHQIGPMPLLFIDIRQVAKRKRNEDQVETDDALNEVSKYITKTSDLLKPNAEGEVVSGETLLDVCDVARWPRMFELLGAARGRKTAKRARLDTSCISPALKSSPAVDSVWTESLEPEEKAKFESMGINFWDAKEAEDPPVRPRPPSWRELLHTLSFVDWLQVIAGRARRGAAFRLKQLADANPRCLLVDGTGKTVIHQEATMEPCFI